MRKWMYILLAVAVVLALLFFYFNSSSAPASSAAYDNVAVSPAILAELHSIANNNTIAAGASIGSGLTQKAANSTPLTVGGRPEVLYVGADFCPYCAADRWALVLALMRFGNFTSLHYMTSSTYSSEPYKGTPTFTFYNSTYGSGLINFTEVELTTNQFNSTTGSYPVLQTPDAIENRIVQQNDPGGSIPFVDFANASVSLGSLSPQILSGMNWTAIVAQLADPSSAVAQSIIGPANAYTAAICRSINNSAAVCSQGYVKSIEAAQ